MMGTFLLGSKFMLVLLFYVSFCYGSTNTAKVVGFEESVDCKEDYIRTSQALLGIKVTIDCKLEDGQFQTRGVGKLNEEGQIMVNVPQEILKDGKLSEECHVQLHNAANASCAFHNGIEASMITFMSTSNQQQAFGPTGQLRFRSVISTLSIIWPPFPKSHPWYKRFHHIFPNPPVILPPIPNKKPFPPPVIKPEPKTDPKTKPKTKHKPKPDPKPNPEPEPKPKNESKPKPKPKPEQKPKPEPKPKPGKKPEPEPKHKREPKPKPKSKPEPKSEPNPKPEPEPEPKCDPKPKPEKKPEPKPKPKPKQEPKPKSKPEPKSCPPQILPPPIQVFKPHPKILPPISPIH